MFKAQLPEDLSLSLMRSTRLGKTSIILLRRTSKANLRTSPIDELH